MGDRRCETCGTSMPARTHRQTDQHGRLVCEECIQMKTPAWNTSYAALDMLQQAELARREAEALTSILRISRLRREAHDSGDMAVIHHCLGGETEYLTRHGVKTLAETVGTTQQVLTSPRGGKSPRWVEAEIRDFGVQPLRKVTLRRNKIIKALYATPGHRWLVGRRGEERIVTTENLRPNHRLASLLTSGVGCLEPDHAGIRHGVIFGDGTVHKARWARVTLWGEKDKQLLPYFPDTSQRPMLTPGGVAGVSITGGFTGEMKTVPSMSETDEYLYGWLAGYFAADGNVTKQGQVVLDCTNVDTLEAVRDVAIRLGICVYGINTRTRQGYGDEPREISRMEFVASTLNPEFFLIEQHRDRYLLRESGYERLGWTVVSIEETDRLETVYCAVVPEHESFVLVDHIWTGNCPFCGSGAVTGGSDGTTECDFCHSYFTVQVQPAHPNMPQTIDGQPTTPPGMPGGEETELSAPSDPAVEEETDGVAEDPLNDANPEQPPAQQPADQSAEEPEEKPKGNQPPWLKKKKSSAARMIPCPECGIITGYDEDDWPQRAKGPGCRFCSGRGEMAADEVVWDPKKVLHPTVQDLLDSKRSGAKYFTDAGDVLSEEKYLAHLAIAHADDVDAVLAAVRRANGR